MKEHEIEQLVDDLSRIPKAVAILEVGLQDVAAGELTPNAALIRFQRIYNALKDESQKRLERKYIREHV